MTALLIALVALAAGALATWKLPAARRRVGSGHDDPPVRRILLPFTGAAISRRALEAAVRLARAENAVIMPAFLARVPRHLPLDSPLPAQCLTGMPVLEAIEQRATAKGVPVDTRVSRGRSYRHALERLLENESFDRIIVSATPNPRTGLSTRDIDWLLEEAPAEIMILRPAPTDNRRVSGEAVAGHF
jgi:nucleotide-binding universal stress UspA family protein